MTVAALRQAFMKLPAVEQASLLDDLIVSSCDATWEERIASEMEERVSAIEGGSMRLREGAEVFQEMRERLRS